MKGFLVWRYKVGMGLRGGLLWRPGEEGVRNCLSLPKNLGLGGGEGAVSGPYFSDQGGGESGTLNVLFVIRYLPEDWLNQVDRCLARHSPCGTTTNQTNNRAPKEPERPGQIWSFLGKKIPFFDWRKQKFLYPHNGKKTPRHLVSHKT